MVRDNRSTAVYEGYLLNDFGEFNFFFPRNRLPHFLACWNRRVSQNNIIIVWNAIYSFLLCIWREMNARSFDDQERMDWIYELGFTDLFS
jgi:hypothetical protein